MNTQTSSRLSGSVLWAGRFLALVTLGVSLVAGAPYVRAADDEDKAEESQGTIGMVMDRARLLMKKLEQRQRKVDPFGMSMDPEDEIVMEEEEEEPEAVKQVTTLDEAVSKFRVTGVVPKRKEVIVGARSLGLGDKIRIEHREVRFELTIVDITARAISLQDDETGEIASVDLGIVPEELPTSMAGGAHDGAAGGSILPMDSAYDVE